MAVTILDPKTVLVVIDLQKGIVSTPHPVADVIGHARALADAFRRHGLPADWADLIPELDQQPTDHRVTKKTWGAFTNTDLDAYLKSSGVTQIVLAGVSTSAGVESTARYAYELGYNVSLAVDAMTDRSTEAHDNSVTRIFPRLGETGTTEDILGLLGSARP